jgi:hypothetical protein
MRGRRRLPPNRCGRAGSPAHPIRSSSRSSARCPTTHGSCRRTCASTRRGRARSDVPDSWTARMFPTPGRARDIRRTLLPVDAAKGDGGRPHARRGRTPRRLGDVAAASAANRNDRSRPIRMTGEAARLNSPRRALVAALARAERQAGLSQASSPVYASRRAVARHTGRSPTPNLPGDTRRFAQVRGRARVVSR